MIFQKLNHTYLRILSFSVAGNTYIILSALKSFSHNDAPGAAASLAYYAFFSIFPLFIFLVSGLSFVLERQIGAQHITTFITNLLPLPDEFITENVNAVLEYRGRYSLLALIGLAYAASGFFHVLLFNINRAWPEKVRRNYVKSRLYALGIIAGLGVLLLLSFFTTTIQNIFHQTTLYTWYRNSTPLAQTWIFISRLFPILIRVLLLWGLFIWVPNVKVNPAAALFGAVTTAILMELLAAALNKFLRSGLFTYDLIYGSLKTVAIYLIFIYLNSYSILLGAHLTSAFHYRNKIH